MQSALAQWHNPEAAQHIAETILEAVTERKPEVGPMPVTAEPSTLSHQTSPTA